MRPRRRLFLILGLAVIAVAGIIYGFPELARRAAIARLEAITHRRVEIHRVSFNPLTGRLAVRGLHVAEQGGAAPFADFEQIDARLDLLSLVHRHLFVREAVIRDSTVRVIRFANGFNLSDLAAGSSSGSAAIDVTVERFTLVGGRVTLEDRTLPEPRTWSSDNIEIQARNISTLREDGTAVATSVTAGAPVRVEVEHLRLYPIHLQSTVTMTGLDLSLAGLYLPPDAPVILQRGRASTSVQVTLDAKAGLRADVSGRLEDVSVVKPGRREPLLIVPKMTSQLTDFRLQDGQIHVGRFEVSGSGSVLDPRTSGRTRLPVSTVQGSIADLTWPIQKPGRLEFLANIPTGGTLSLNGVLRPPPSPSQVRLRLAGLDVAPWAQFLPGSARVNGVVEADLRIDEPLEARVPARVRGSIALDGLGIADGSHEILQARQVEASGLEVHWPTRLVITQLLVTAPHGVLERDHAGEFPVLRLGSVPSSSSHPASSHPAPRGPAPVPSAGSTVVDVREIVVRDAALDWRDEALGPPVRLDFSGIEARVSGIGWPLRGPLAVAVALRPPGGGELRASGRVGVDPLTADLRLSAKAVDLAPYQPYAPTAARISGWTDLDLAVQVPPLSTGRATVRGTAALSRVEVRDQERTMVRLGRAVATDLDVEWPRRLSVRELTLEQPWVLLDRDKAGAMTLGNLLTGGAGAARQADGKPGNESRSMAVAVGQLQVDDGGVRVVDRHISPPFAVDLSRLSLRADGLATAPAKPAHVEINGRAGPGSDLNLRGTVGAIGGPFQLDVSGDLQGFWVPRTNPYALGFIGWGAREGFLATSITCRIEGGSLSARTETRLSRLEIAPGHGDEAKAHIGLPLGLLVALMKDRNGNIDVSLPVNGRLDDPHFDFSAAIWHAVRIVVVHAIAAPISWIGRIQYTQDSRIDRIEVDPVRFQPGAAVLTPAEQEHVARIAAFLQQSPEMRLTLRPSISSKDLTELKQRALRTELEGIARAEGIAPDAAAARLFQQRFPTAALPATPDAIRAALLDGEPLPASAGPDLAAQRVRAARATLEGAGINRARLVLVPSAEGQQAADGQVQLDLVPPDRLQEPRAAMTGPVTGAEGARQQPGLGAR